MSRTLPRIAIATVSLGRAAAGHKLPTKIQAAKTAGFDGIELTFDCLLGHAKDLAPPESVSDWSEADALRTAAKDVKRIVDDLQIEIISLQPFMNYDGLIHWEERHEVALQWIELCQIVGTKILQMPSQTYPTKSSEIDTTPSHVATNLRRLADACSPHGIEIAYEGTAWGLIADNWQQIDELITLADRPNVKHCLDTFHIAVLLAGDATSPQTQYRQPNTDERVKEDMESLTKAIKADKINCFQLSDAGHIDVEQKGYPVVDLNNPPGLTWSRNSRIFPFDDKYECVLAEPVLEVIKAVFATGYRGWVSQEVFHVDLYDSRPSIPTEWAERGMRSWKKVVEVCEL